MIKTTKKFKGVLIKRWLLLLDLITRKLFFSLEKEILKSHANIDDCLKHYSMNIEHASVCQEIKLPINYPSFFGCF